MLIKKAHGCHPAGHSCDNKCGAQVTYANLIPNSILNITVQSPDDGDGLGVSAIGHFSIKIDNDDSLELWKEPTWVNGCQCKNCTNIPVQYSFLQPFYMKMPPKGTEFEIWIAIYWSCKLDDSSFKPCHSENVYHRDYVR
ncbi:18096_t:CDS:2 [Acaulospora morrowiae]|uniref:18096_t:CDS:1 n=1 Tax=Acaulospora morrowiae TaxID=94023 RepID=A0A9N8VSW0_9GLOM|nr:18096_t:CDS:2 [Acaulospora morrowiae]